MRPFPAVRFFTAVRRLLRRGPFLPWDPSYPSILPLAGKTEYRVALVDLVLREGE